MGHGALLPFVVVGVVVGLDMFVMLRVGGCCCLWSRLFS